MSRIHIIHENDEWAAPPRAAEAPRTQCVWILLRGWNCVQRMCVAWMAIVAPWASRRKGVSFGNDRRTTYLLEKLESVNSLLKDPQAKGDKEQK